MLELPQARDIKVDLADPLKLKSRGFAQNSRVVRGGGGSNTGETSSSTLWTETPAERAIRLQEEAEGRKPRAQEDHATVDELERLRDARRAAEIEASIREARGSREKTLLELHQERRRDEHTSSRRRRDHDHDQERHRSSRRRDRSRSPDRSKRHRSRSRSPDSSKHRHRHRHHHRSSRDSKHESDNHRQHKDRRESSRSSKVHSSRHEDGSSDRKRSGKERDREKTDERRTEERERRADAASAKVGKWDWDSMMGQGSRALGEGARKQMLKDAAGLSEKFGKGSSSYL